MESITKAISFPKFNPDTRQVEIFAVAEVTGHLEEGGEESGYTLQVTGMKINGVELDAVKFAEFEAALAWDHSPLRGVAQSFGAEEAYMHFDARVASEYTPVQFED